MGLAAAFSALYIILVQVHYDLTFNKNIKDSERICVVFAPGWTGIDSYQANMSRPMANRLFKDCPLIEYYAVGDVGWQSDGCVERDGEIKEMSIKTAKINNTFLNVLGVEIIAGNIEDLEKPYSCAISESFAKKYNLEIDDIFYNSIKPDPNSISIVKLIYKDIVGNNDFSNIELFYDMDNENLEDWSNWNYTYFIKYKKGANISGLMNHIHNEGKKLLEERGTKNEEIEEELNKFKFKLVPLRESIFNEDRSNLRRSNRTTVYTLLSLAILVVIIALINFINFFFALVPLRIKNVNTKKVFGSSNLKLRLSFITEALGIIFISLIISYITVQLLKNSYLADCISCSIEFNSNTFSIIITVLSGILIALIGSIYPSIYITSFPTAMVIKGGFASSKSGRILRNILISLQFIISITLISSSLFIKTQYNYMVNYDLGFNKTNVFSVYIPQNLVRTIESRNILDRKSVV